MKRSVVIKVTKVIFCFCKVFQERQCGSLFLKIQIDTMKTKSD